MCSRLDNVPVALVFAWLRQGMLVDICEVIKATTMLLLLRHPLRHRNVREAFIVFAREVRGSHVEVFCGADERSFAPKETTLQAIRNKVRALTLTATSVQCLAAVFLIIFLSTQQPLSSVQLLAITKLFSNFSFLN